MTSRADAALLAAVLPLAAATLLAQRRTDRPDPAIIAWQALPTRVRCLLERGSSAWLNDRVHVLARDMALQHAIDGMSEADSLERLCDAIWAQEVERHAAGMNRDKNQYHATRYIALLEGREGCPHADAEHAQPTGFRMAAWRYFVDGNITVDYVPG